MAINIKELFDADSDNIKVEKTNYNFDQILANGGGPIGPKGVQGTTGNVGQKGDEGDKGDKGDGIPNILSPDNAIIDEIRQSPMTKKKIQHWAENSDNLKGVMTEEEYRNYQRNKTLIDLNEIPESIQSEVINTFNGQKVPMKMKVLNYLIKKRCNLLIESVEEFYNG